MLLDPLEEKFDLPPASIEFGDRDWGEGEIVGEQDEPISGFGVVESDAAQWRIEVLVGVGTREHDGLVADQSGVAIDLMRIAALEPEIGPGSGHKEAACLVKPEEATEVDVATIHDVEGSGFGQQQVQNIHVVKFAVADVQERGDIAAQVQKRVQFDCCLGRTVGCPGKQRQAQVDGTGVQGIDGLFQIDAKRLVRIQTPSHANQSLRKVGIDTPVAHFVGIGQRAARTSCTGIDRGRKSS